MYPSPSKLSLVLCALVFHACLTPCLTQAQDLSIAREWNEQLLQSIREDDARPTVHARNLFHMSAMMYDLWCVFHPVGTEEPYLLGKTLYGFEAAFEGFTPTGDHEAALQEAISYACYRLIAHRFNQAVRRNDILNRVNAYMTSHGYDISFQGRDYSTGNAAALGNHISALYIDYGRQDGANEPGYLNENYEPVNEPLAPQVPGIVTDDMDPNRWQPLKFENVRFVGQSGVISEEIVPSFISAEWGLVNPFALKRTDLSVKERDGREWWVYHDPGPPPFLSYKGKSDTDEYYKWGFSLVASWSSHLTTSDNVMWDISPASIGNVGDYPETWQEYEDFYDYMEGGDNSQGWPINPHTGEPYPAQRVPRGDYTRVLAEFWADGPESETPPGHWYFILNYVNDNPLLEKRIRGEGPVLSNLEWDIKSYFLLGGALHDAAVSAWGIKGYYDYIRPISAIRWMATYGQNTNLLRAAYHKHGLPLVADRIDVIDGSDDFSRSENGPIKLYAWRGHNFLTSAQGIGGVNWMPASEWWPYQRPNFVTPPFAGYVSGHSTFSSAAAETLTRLTGDPYFPGGVGEFRADRNSFLQFELGPSQDMILQWATYRDAADQCSLSRIWGGIHPPADDMPGRIIGKEVGEDAFAKAMEYFEGSVPDPEPAPEPTLQLYPNPWAQGELSIAAAYGQRIDAVSLWNAQGKLVAEFQVTEETGSIALAKPEVQSGLYILKIHSGYQVWLRKLVIP
ncbi:MAG: T9SS type A sorting domain-containing protein [Bacteroidota bacterium]